MTDFGMWGSYPVILCAVCLADEEATTESVKAAATLLDGYAVCLDHANWIGFSRDVQQKIQEQWDIRSREREKKEKTVT